MDKLNYTYMLRCSDGSLYTGWTNNLEKRVQTHKKGLGGKYTHSHRPLSLVYYESFEDSHQAMSREVQIKRLTKSEKEELIRNLSFDRAVTIDRINRITEDVNEG